LKRLTIDIESVAQLRNLFNEPEFNPTRFAILSEVAGAHGIVASLGDGKKSVLERDIKLIKETHISYLNLHIPAKDPQVKTALSLSPNMVTFVDFNSSDPQNNILPLSSNIISGLLPDILPDFQANNISVAAFIPPEISVLKQLSKVEIDYVEFDCNRYTFADDSNDELVELDNIRSAILGAAKLGLGVNCFGGISYDHLPALASIPQLEDITMGLSILKRAIEVGVNQAIQEAMRQILTFQKD
jgi:pyridoxine 5-phosphate synthase